jgi:hypothetical protein
MLRWAERWNEAPLLCVNEPKNGRVARPVPTKFFLQIKLHTNGFSEGLPVADKNGGHVTWESLDISCVFSTGSRVSPSALLLTRCSGHRESTGRW